MHLRLVWPDEVVNRKWSNLNECQRNQQIDSYRVFSLPRIGDLRRANMSTYFGGHFLGWWFRLFSMAGILLCGSSIFRPPGLSYVTMVPVYPWFMGNVNDGEISHKIRIGASASPSTFR